MQVSAHACAVAVEGCEGDGLHHSGAVTTVRIGDSAAVWFFYKPHRWLITLVRRVGADAFARIVDVVPNLAGFAKAVARVEVSDNAVKLTQYAATQRGARELERLKPKRRVVVDVSAAARLPSTFGTKGNTQ